MESIVSVNWLKENKNLENLILLDASPQENKSNLKTDFEGLSIPHSLHFDMKNVFVDKEHEISNMFPSPEKFEQECQHLGINKDSIIVVYDNLGIYTSPRVWWMFKTMGHENVAVLDGGLPEWINLGNDGVKAHHSPLHKGNFKANYLAEYIADAQFVLDQLNNKQTCILDARSKGRFYGKVPEPRENMESGHIPNSINLPFQQVLSNGKLRPKEELKEIVSQTNIDNKKLIFSCGSGITASILLLAFSQVTSNEKALYDGSWAEWGVPGKFPISV